MTYSIFSKKTAAAKPATAPAKPAVYSRSTTEAEGEVPVKPVFRSVRSRTLSRF